MATGWWWVLGLTLVVAAAWMLAWAERWYGQRLSRSERQRVADAIEALQREVQR